MRVLTQVLGFALLLVAWLPVAIATPRQVIIHEHACKLSSQVERLPYYSLPTGFQQSAAHQVRFARAFALGQDTGTVELLTSVVHSCVRSGENPALHRPFFHPSFARKSGSLPRAPCQA